MLWKVYICEEYVMISEHNYNYVIKNYNADIFHYT